MAFLLFSKAKMPVPARPAEFFVVLLAKIIVPLKIWPSRRLGSRPANIGRVPARVSAIVGTRF